MLGVSCLVKNTQLSDDLKDLVEYIGYNQISTGKDASVVSVYNIVRKAGIEVDLQTIGYIYNEILPKEYSQFMSDTEVNDYILKSFNDAVERAAMLEEKTPKEEQIGQDAPEVYVTNGIFNMFYNTEVPDESTQSDMIKMQNALWKGIQRKLKLPESQKPKNDQEWKSILNQALGYEQLGLTDLNGKINGIADLYDAMREQLKNAMSEAQRQANPADYQRLSEMINGLEATTYSLLFSKGEAKRLLEEMMKEAAFGKTLKNGKIILDWNKLAGDIGNVQDLRENIQRVLEDNGYGQDAIDGVKNSLENEFNDLYARVLEKKTEIAERASQQVTKEAQRMAEKLKKLQEELLRVSMRRSKQRPQKNSKEDKEISDEEKRLLDEIKLEQEKWDSEIKAAKEAKRDYRKMEAERNRQLKIVYDLNTKLTQLKNGTYVTPTKNKSAEDVQEIEELKERVRNEMELFTRDKDTGRTVEQKSDLKRLAELNNLGIFESTHDRVLYKLLGVGELQQQDIEDLKAISQAASNLYREIDKNYGSEVFASRQFQALQRSIDSIIARNINDKGILLKILAVIKNYLEVFLTGLLSGPFTILENLWSGVKEMLVPTLMGAGVNKQDAQIYWRTLSDVVQRGQSFGEEVGSFAPRELFTNTLQWKWNGGTAKEKAKSLLFVLTIPARVGLLGFDSANKVTITNKTFKNAIYQALTQNGMSKEDTKKFMNEALYGQSFDRAKQQAKEIIEKTNIELPDKYKIPVNNNTITTLANDLVKANLNANGALNNDIIEAAYKSSYHVAGYGLGHEPNNWFSSAIKGYREKSSREEERLAKQKDWNGLAIQRLKSTFINNIIIRFAGGATNWVFLRLQSGLGVGLATGFLGKWNKDIDFESKKTIKQSIKDIHNARNKIGRSLVGLSLTALSYIIGFALYGGEDDDEDKIKKLEELNAKKADLKKTNYREFEGGSEEKASKVIDIDIEIRNMELSMSVMKRIKANWMSSRLFKKVAPDIMLMQYYMDTEKNTLLAASKYVQNTYGVGNEFTTGSKIQNAAELAWKGDIDAGYGQLGSIAGDRFGVPLWKAGKDWINLVKWIGGKEVSSDFKSPSSFAEGLWGGGMMEDLGVYKRNPPITILPGIGASGYEKFKSKGITNMSHLKKAGNWWEMTYTNESGNDVYILSAPNRVKAKEAAENYEKQK